MAHTTREQHTRMLCTAGLMAALACVSNFISIATPASRIHIGNAFCVLCGLILGPAYGFFAAGVGNAIFDIIGGYGMGLSSPSSTRVQSRWSRVSSPTRPQAKRPSKRRITPASSSAACSAR
ncbi:MAG: ECF transporter S component [Christensenellales bacterium]